MSKLNGWKRIFLLFSLVWIIPSYYLANNKSLPVSYFASDRDGVYADMLSADSKKTLVDKTKLLNHENASIVRFKDSSSFVILRDLFKRRLDKAKEDNPNASPFDLIDDKDFYTIAYMPNNHILNFESDYIYVEGYKPVIDEYMKIVTKNSLNDYRKHFALLFFEYWFAPLFFLYIFSSGVVWVKIGFAENSKNL